MLNASQLRTFVIGVLLVPGSVLVYIPFALMWFVSEDRNSYEPSGVDQLRVYLGVLLFVLGIAVATWSMRLFATLGNGTPVPTSPPINFVVSGPYRYVRNPMIIGIMIALLGECVFFASWYVTYWLAFVLVGNLIYIGFFEEKELEKRFGSEYVDYKNNVPGWIPRLRPWEPPAM